MDASGYETVDGLRYTRYVKGITARRVRELGGDVAKMLFYIRPDQQGAESVVADEMRALVERMRGRGAPAHRRAVDLPAGGGDRRGVPGGLPALVADGARLAVECGAKVLKLQYPGSAEACAAVTEAAAGVPWAVLSAGVDHETFIEPGAIAMANGAAARWRAARSGRTASSISVRRAAGPADHSGAAPAPGARGGRRRPLGVAGTDRRGRRSRPPRPPGTWRVPHPAHQAHGRARPDLPAVPHR